MYSNADLYKKKYFLPLKFVSYLNYYIPNGILHPIWAIGPNLLNFVYENNWAYLICTSTSVHFCIVYHVHLHVHFNGAV